VPAVLRKVNDPEPWVRRQLAATLGELKPGPQKEAAVATLLTQHGDDPITVDAAISGVRGSEAPVLDRLLQAAGAAQTASLDSAIQMVAAEMARSGDDAAIQRLFGSIVDPMRADWQRSAVLRGVERATGAAGGGGRGGRGAAALNADTGPGGRGAPAGDRAYPLPGGDVNSEVFFGANPAPPPVTIKLTREPVLVAFAARDNSDVGARARRVLDHVEWAGKPGIARAAAPLTADEQRRFDTGRAVYEAKCLGCHQADGRGLPSIAPALAGAAFATAAPDVTTRIVLNGKEGAVRPDAADRRDVEVTTSGRRADVYPARMGQHGVTDRRGCGQGHPRGDRDENTAVDRRRTDAPRERGRAVTTRFCGTGTDGIPAEETDDISLDRRVGHRADCLPDPASAAQLLTTATITGSVKDAQGGVLPGVTITLTSESKGTAVPAVVTEANGEFVVANLAPTPTACRSCCRVQDSRPPGSRSRAAIV
jgi:mono/diheme cytochrome c family protein